MEIFVGPTGDRVMINPFGGNLAAMSTMELFDSILFKDVYVSK